MSPRLINDLKRGLDLIPTCMDYSELLGEVERRTGKNREQFRSGKGEWTYADWAEFLGIS